MLSLARNDTLCFFVDGIDEFEAKVETYSRHSIFEYLESLYRLPPNGRFCISSGDGLEYRVTLQPKPHLILNEHTKRDIPIYHDLFTLSRSFWWRNVYRMSYWKIISRKKLRVVFFWASWQRILCYDAGDKKNRLTG